MSKGVDTMMERSRRNRKFSLKYRIEKWFYEDSLRHFGLAFKAIGMFIICLIGLVLLFIVPALFH